MILLGKDWTSSLFHFTIERSFMKRKSILFLYLLLLAIGLAYETQSLTEGWMSGSQYGIVGLSTLILMVYAIPAVWALFHFAKKWKLSWVPVLFSLLGGGFVAGWLSSFANTYFHDMIQAIAPNSDFWNQYESAIAAPLFEEPFKLIPIFFVLYLFSVRRIKSIFLLAIASGLGFQIVEDFSYIRQDLPEGFSYTVSGILGRVAHVSLGLHMPCHAGAIPDCPSKQRTQGSSSSRLGILSSWVWTPFCWQFTFLTNRDRVADCDSSFECYRALPNLPSLSNRRAIRTSKIRTKNSKQAEPANS